MELLARLHAAFPVRPRPEMTLHQGQLADETIRREIGESEWQQAAKRDEGRTWDTIPDTALIECDCALSHLDENSFIYHLPAFLAFAVRNINAPSLTPEHKLVGSVVFAITDRSPYSLSRYVLLTPAQRSAVVSFLEFMQLHSQYYCQDASKALERYWLKPAQPLIEIAR